MRRVLPFILLLLLGGGAFTWWWSQPERVVARRVASFFNAAHVAEDTSDLVRSTRGGAIEPYLAPNVTLRGPEETEEYADGPVSRSSLSSNYTAAARGTRQIAFGKPECDPITVTGDSATVGVRVDAVVELSDGYRPADGILDMTMKWQKLDGDWVLSEVSWKEVPR